MNTFINVLNTFTNVINVFTIVISKFGNEFMTFTYVNKTFFDVNLKTCTNVIAICTTINIINFTNKGLFIKLRQNVLFETLKLGVQISIDLEVVEPKDK